MSGLTKDVRHPYLHLVLGNFLIGLREGLEATLVVSILIAYLVRTGRRDELLPVWIGVGLAAALSLGARAMLTFVQHDLDTFKAQETFGGVMSLVAVGFVTWMVFWMRRTSRSMKGELQDKLHDALEAGTTAIVVTAFVAVIREGLETALFVWSAAKAAGSTSSPLTGAMLGIFVSIVLGYLLCRKAVHVDLATFFLWTRAGLILVAAGVLAYGIHDLWEAGIFSGPLFDTKAFDVSTTIPPSSWYGTLLRGTFNFRPDPSIAKVIVWLTYLSVTLTRSARPARSSCCSRRPAPTSTSAASTTTRPAAWRARSRSADHRAAGGRPEV